VLMRAPSVNEGPTGWVCSMAQEEGGGRHGMVVREGSDIEARSAQRKEKGEREGAWAGGLAGLLGRLGEVGEMANGPVLGKIILN
jgi:hypothetical protein